jgi:hypothetical protein
MNIALKSSPGANAWQVAQNDQTVGLHASSKKLRIRAWPGSGGIARSVEVNNHALSGISNESLYLPAHPDTTTFILHQKRPLRRPILTRL